MRFKTIDEPKSTRIFVRVTPAEKEDLELRAADCCMSVSAFVLKAVQGRQTRTKHDLILINELRLIGLHLKEIYQAEKPRAATELEPVMKAIVEAIDRIATESRFS